MLRSVFIDITVRIRLTPGPDQNSLQIEASDSQYITSKIEKKSFYSG